MEHLHKNWKRGVTVSFPQAPMLIIGGKNIEFRDYWVILFHVALLFQDENMENSFYPSNLSRVFPMRGTQLRHLILQGMIQTFIYKICYKIVATNIMNWLFVYVTCVIYYHIWIGIFMHFKALICHYLLLHMLLYIFVPELIV